MFFPNFALPYFDSRPVKCTSTIISSQVFFQLSRKCRRKAMRKKYTDTEYLILLSATCSALSFGCNFLAGHCIDERTTKDLYTVHRVGNQHLTSPFRWHSLFFHFLWERQRMCVCLCLHSIVFVLHLSSVIVVCLICYCGWEHIEAISQGLHICICRWCREEKTALIYWISCMTSPSIDRFSKLLLNRFTSMLTLHPTFLLRFSSVAAFFYLLLFFSFIILSII